MIHCEPDFFNKVANDLDKAYFPSEERFRNPKYSAAKYALELFNNGCLNYRKLIGRLAKNCGDTTANLHSLVEPHIISFGNYTYKPKSKD